MGDREYVINVEGHEVIINLTNAARFAIKDLGLNEYPIYGTVLAMGKRLLEMADNERFIIIDEMQQLGIVGVKDCRTVAVDIIMVVESSNIYIRRGTKVFKYGLDD